MSRNVRRVRTHLMPRMLLQANLAAQFGSFLRRRTVCTPPLENSQIALTRLAFAIEREA